MAYDQSHQDHDVFHSGVHFQLPSFVCSAAPTLAPGGGAEVLPVSLLADNNIANTWFSNSGFAPRSFNVDQYSHNDHQPQEEDLPQPRQQQHSASSPFEFDSYIQPSSQPLRPLAQTELSAFTQPRPLVYPHLPFSDLPLGLPVYSASGFDLLSILARVANRPHPRVILGPVDLTCSFVVVDVRRFDHPIVYCSPTFCRLTGYSEHEILGRNCRFLQAPNGQVQRGETRHFTDQTAVAHLKKNLSADKECQTSIVNYKKDGTAFINLVTVIPILGGASGAPHEESDVVYHVGFQVDLTEQPNAILEKLRDGSYVVDYASQRLPLPMQPSSFIGVPNPNHTKDRKSQGVPSVRISRDLKKLLADPSFVKSIPITTSTTIPPSQPTSSAALRAETDVPASITGSNQLLHLILLEASPDFIHVVSLKGNFLYVAPSVRRVLGYEPEEMVGGSISDYAHPEDVVPLMRELKEGSATGLAAVSATSSSGDSGEGGGNTAATDQSSSSHAVAMAGNMQMAPRTVDLLFRARTKAGPYVWIECKGRLHVEPGKGRKAIVLSGRAKEMPKLEWHHIARGGGLGLPVPMIDEDGTRRMVETEMWGTMTSGQSCGGVVSFLVVGHGVSDVLGWTPSELVGREVINYIVDGVHQFSEEVRILRSGESNPRRFFCKMRHKNGSSVDVVFVLYRSTNDSSATESIQGIIPAPLIYQIRTLQSSAASSATSFVHSLNSDVFEELDTSRDSSWQYEIQQIRFANKRLEDEIATLEKQLEDAEGVQQKVLDELQGDHQYSTTNNSSSSPLHSSSSPSVLLYPFMERQQHHPPDIQSPTSHYPTSTSLFSTQSTAAPLSGYSRDWDSVFVQQQQQSRLHQQRLKRSWDDHR